MMEIQTWSHATFSLSPTLVPEVFFRCEEMRREKEAVRENLWLQVSWESINKQPITTHLSCEYMIKII